MLGGAGSPAQHVDNRCVPSAGVLVPRKCTRTKVGFYDTITGILNYIGVPDWVRNEIAPRAFTTRPVERNFISSREQVEMPTVAEFGLARARTQHEDEKERNQCLFSNTTTRTVDRQYGVDDVGAAPAI